MFSSDFGFEIINVDDLSLQEERFLPSELLAYARDENDSSFVRDIEGHLALVYQLLDTQGHVDDVTPSAMWMHSLLTVPRLRGR